MRGYLPPGAECPKQESREDPMRLKIIPKLNFVSKAHTSMGETMDETPSL